MPCFSVSVPQSWRITSLLFVSSYQTKERWQQLEKGGGPGFELVLQEKIWILRVARPRWRKPAICFCPFMAKIFTVRNAPAESSMKAANCERLWLFYELACYYSSLSSRHSQALLRLKYMLFLILNSVQKSFWRSKLEPWPSLIPLSWSSLLLEHLENVAV